MNPPLPPVNNKSHIQPNTKIENMIIIICMPELPFYQTILQYETLQHIPEWASSYVPTKQWYEFAPPHIAHTSPLSYAPPVPPLHPRARRCCNNCDCDGCLLLLLFLGFLRSDPSRLTTAAAAAAAKKMEVYCLPFLILPWWCY